MTRYTEISTALDFAVKYGASAVTIDMDSGHITLSPQSAQEAFDGLEIGEPFRLIAIYFESPDDY